ncbi:hypothetical protein C8R44DRAFT_742279 [Mycena epipterygia]|nr:hypothetical protein C8R44DRAFT_742279 [Mycena epipterygia]
MDIDMEREFCSNFKCCDVKLSDLHALFDHLGKCHQHSDIQVCGLPVSSPCSAAAPASYPHSYPAFSEFVQLPVCPPTPPPLPQKSKSLFTRALRPLLTTSPISRTTPESSPPSAPALESESANYPSAYTRDTIYAPVAVPSTLRLDRPQESVLSWSVAQPSSFWGGGLNPLAYGYVYHPAAVPLAPVPVQPHKQLPPNAEIIDVDLVSSPSPPAEVVPVSAESEPLSAATTSPASAPPPAESLPPPPPVLEVETVDSGRPRPSTAIEPPAKRHCSLNLSSRVSSVASLTSLRHRFLGAPVVRNSNAAAPIEVSSGAHSSTAQYKVVVGTEVVDACEVQGHRALEIEIEVADADITVPDKCEAQGGNGDKPLPKRVAVEDVRDSDTPPTVAPVATKANLHLDGRKRTFVCPVPGCIKTYLTQNGLRYHEEKGKCVTASGSLCVLSTISSPASDGSTVNPAATTSEALDLSPGVEKSARAPKRPPSLFQPRTIATLTKPLPESDRYSAFWLVSLCVEDHSSPQSLLFSGGSFGSVRYGAFPYYNQ